MNAEKIRTGFGAMEIVAIVFTAIGGFFTAAAAVFLLNLDALRMHGSGDVWVLPLVFGAVGVPFLAVGLAFVGVCLHKKAVCRRAAEGGYYVMADVAAIRPDWSVRVNGQCPYVLECHYRDPSSGALHVFKSRNLYFYPEELQGKQLRVYVDRENWKHYYVDVESVLPDVRIH